MTSGLSNKEIDEMLEVIEEVYKKVAAKKMPAFHELYANFYAAWYEWVDSFLRTNMDAYETSEEELNSNDMKLEEYGFYMPDEERFEQMLSLYIYREKALETEMNIW